MSEGIEMTGNYPDGKLGPDDQGEMRFMIGIKEGRVLIHFATPVVWIAMRPMDAIQMAASLIEKAKACGWGRENGSDKVGSG